MSIPGTPTTTRPPRRQSRPLENLIDTLGIPRRLSDWGVSEADLALIAQDAMEDLVVATNPRPIATQEEVVELLHRAL